MNSLLKSAFLAGLLGLASSASAQVVLQNFSAFESPTNTFFVGSWEATGDPGGSTSPLSTFSQGAGFYNFVGGLDDNASGAYYFFNSSLNITGQTLLSLTAHTLAGNAATTFDIILFDSLGHGASATFGTSLFAGAGFSTAQGLLTPEAGFNFADLTSFLITGNNVGSSATLNIAFDNLATATPAAAGAVPEPSTYGLFGAVAVLGIVVARKRRKV